MNKLNRNPIIYVTSNIIDSKLQENIKNSKLKSLYTDVWMTLDDLEQFEKASNNNYEKIIIKPKQYLSEALIEYGVNLKERWRRFKNN